MCLNDEFQQAAYRRLQRLIGAAVRLRVGSNFMDAASRPERDYFPWLVAGLSLLTTAIAIGIAAFDPQTHPQTQSTAAVIGLTAALDTDTAPAVPHQVMTQAPPPDSAPAAQLAAPSVTRVWECTVNGLRTFSDAPCGAAAVAREIAEPNRMEAVPVMPASLPHGGLGPYYPSDMNAEASGWNSDAPGSAADLRVQYQPYARRAWDRRPHHRDPGSGARPHMVAHR
jgi:hypothetical protein